jgi:hypothetical protein
MFTGFFSTQYEFGMRRDTDSQSTFEENGFGASDTPSVVTIINA